MFDYRKKKKGKEMCLKRGGETSKTPFGMKEGELMLS
jgi:hypothetical protein